MSNKIIVNGVAYSSLSEVCRDYGVGYQKVYNRLRSGWSIEEALSKEDNRGKSGNTISLNGKEFGSVKEACDFYGISYNTVNARIAKGYPLKSAIKMERIENSGKNVVINGVTYSSIKEACQAFKISPSIVYQRIRCGWSVEEALTMPMRRK